MVFAVLIVLLMLAGSGLALYALLSRTVRVGPICPRCGDDLRGAIGRVDICPECGASARREDGVGTPRVSDDLAAVALGAACLSLILLIVFGVLASGG